MANREVEAILRISSKLGSMAALRTLQRELNAVQKQAVAYNRTNSMMMRQLNSGWATTTRALGPAVAAYAGYQAIRSYAEAERRIGQIGITAGATEKETQQMMSRLRNTASELRVPFQDVVSEMETLISSGKSLEEAYALMPSVGKAAKASGADFADMATTADALSGSLKIAAGNMESAFDILAYGGKVGKFELRDMAAELPSLAPAFAALGYQGEEGLKKLVAMLQGVRKETGSSSEAATAMQNVLQKINVDQTAKSFKKFGIDSRKALADAKREGRDVLDTFVDLAFQATKGDLDKLPQLFTDAQFLQGMRALMNQRSQIHAWQQDMSGAAGTVARDFQRSFRDAQSALDEFWNSVNRISGAGAQGFVSLGGVKAIDAVATDLERLSAALEGGWSPIDSLAATARGEDASKVVDAFAWRAGYRTPEQQAMINGYREFADRAEASKKAAAGFVDGEVLPGSARDERGFPVKGPIPKLRDAPAAMPIIGDGGPRVPMPTSRDAAIAAVMRDEFDQEVRRQDAARRAREDVREERVFSAFGTNSDDKGRSVSRMLAGMERPTDTISSMLSGMDRVGEQIKQGGQAVEEAGTSAGSAMEDGATAMRTAASTIEAAAAKLLSAVASIPRTITVNTGGGVSADVGRSNGGVKAGPR